MHAYGVKVASKGKMYKVIGGCDEVIEFIDDLGNPHGIFKWDAEHFFLHPDKTEKKESKSSGKGKKNNQYPKKK